MSMKFTPVETDSSHDVPYFEDARADYAPYYSAASNWTIAKAKLAVQTEMGKLGGTVLEFAQGDFDDNGRLRRGYLIRFVMNGAQGRITVAGLPIKKWTQKRMDSVRIQALLIIRDWLKVQVTSMIFSPGNNPLIPHLLTPGGMTLAEMVADQASVDVPKLAAGVIEGEVVD